MADGNAGTAHTVADDLSVAGDGADKDFSGHAFRLHVRSKPTCDEGSHRQQ
jgi:hypothetical protein